MVSKRQTKTGSRCNLLIAALVSMFALSGYAQQADINSINDKFDTYRKQALQEKLYVHLDRAFYYNGERMWFTIYAVDGTLHKPLDISAVAYLEVIDFTNQAVAQTKIQLKNGGGNGSLVLPVSVSSGNYLVRAYTRWMQNADPEFYFQQPISILNALRKPEAISVPETDAITIQFFPEGGHLVKNVKSKVAFHATNKEGHGLDFNGVIVNAANDTLVHFQSIKFGIGNFTFTPEESQAYRVIVKTKGKVTSYPLPATKDYGYSLNLSDSSDRIRLTATARLTEGESEVVYLLVHSRNQVATSVSGKLQRGKTAFTFDKKLLGDGINHLTLFNGQGQPVCERLYFRQPENNLLITTTSDKTEYERRSKISLAFDARTTTGNVSPAHLSVAVYRKDSVQKIQLTSIDQYLWLTSELRGTVESPAYYMKGTQDAYEAMDNLMLTHGWSRFSWNDVLKGTLPSYQFIPESRGHVVTGTVTNMITNVPASQIRTYLSIPGKEIRLYAANSGQQGQVMFPMKDFYGMNKLVMQTNTQQDSIYKLKIDDSFSPRFSSIRLPAFSVSRAAKNRILSQSIHAQVQTVFYADSSKVTGRSRDTIAFYGNPSNRYYLDDYTRFSAMEDVLREYVGPVWLRKTNNKLHFWVLDELNGGIFKDNSMVLVDGVPVFNEEKILAFDPLKVKKLDIVARQYYLGPAEFNGIVSYITATGDLANFPLDTRSLVQNYEGLQHHREFYAPLYKSSADRNSHLPDFRDLLFWTPELKADANGKYSLEFYSSDQTGNYEVIVQGITDEGLPGSSSTTFDVRDLSN